MATNSRTKLEELRMVVWFALAWVYWLATAHAPRTTATPFPQLRCAACGELMRMVAITYDLMLPTLSQHALAYLNSG